MISEKLFLILYSINFISLEMEKECITLGLDLIQQSDNAFLTTIDENGYPSTRAVFNLRNVKRFPWISNFMKQFENDFTLFFTTNTSSVKISHIKNNPKVSVYYCDSNMFKGFMCQGKIEIVTDEAIRSVLWHDDWNMYYPGGKDGGDYTVLRLKPNYIKGYFNLHQTDLQLSV